MITDEALESHQPHRHPQPGVSVVVPVFNSKATLPALVREVSSALDDIRKPYEILLVNDGSVDGSWNEIVRLVEGSDRLRGIDLSRNFGQHNAELCGLRLASYDVTVTLDDDLQHPANEIPKLLRALECGCDVVYGRSDKGYHSRLRDGLATFTKKVVGKTMGLSRVASQSPFRALRTELRSAFAGYSGPDVLLDALLGWSTDNFCSIVVEHRPRRQGKSTYTASRLLDMGILTLTAYSTTPLRLASWLGFGFTAFGMIVLCYAVILALFVGSVPGFPFLASLISIFSGMQLFLLGLFGEYLTRVFNRALGRPTYVIRNAIGRKIANEEVSKLASKEERGMELRARTKAAPLESGSIRSADGSTSRWQSVGS